MNSQEVIQQTIQFVKEELQHDSSGHDWWHIYRVTELTKTIAEKEGADLFICTMAALLHDIADEKLNESEEAGLQKVKLWLTKNNVTIKHSAAIMEIITTMSFKGGNRPPVRTLEAKVVQDADRLDAIGAIGIARTFAYAGAKGDLMYDPDIPVRDAMTKEEYRSGKSTAVNHFYEKLLKLKELMNTNAAKEVAEERHQFMETYLEHFNKEWNAKI